MGVSDEGDANDDGTCGDSDGGQNDEDERERGRERERRRRASSRLEEVRGQEVESGDFRVKSKGFIYVHAGTPGTGSGLLVLLMIKQWWNDDAIWRHVLQCSSASLSHMIV